ncbi:1-acyl-sn-glycerol-3-phosphate acyltransferase [Frateuria soli]|uniref:1-acyl-sn-glycerol-3-phosphate acyltransferase n=1 Tax=Frateuria soli TaxID=1542730 RepID=UPI001E2A6ECE|nr:1-acyl-sn-glycerol-3-phosphate acyltransferase [Frateuria soli]UGB37917.1 1-acyl-sn-glycerol-3-phosphate acyltransferase [Frateuria soli]
MSDPVLPPLPPQAPRIDSRFWPWLMRGLLRLSGWRLLGDLPDVPKLIIIGAPHSSYWDGVWGLMMKIALGADIKVMIKREVLDSPLGLILRPLGMIGINRKAALNVVGQMVRRFANHPRMWLGITPEGTRKHVVHWKSGFLRIARDAGVPILPVFLDYPTKTFTLGKPQYATDDPDADMARIRALFRGYRGKHRNTEQAQPEPDL